MESLDRAVVLAILDAVDRPPFNTTDTQFEATILSGGREVTIVGQRHNQELKLSMTFSSPLE